jgi:hypothetical protein
MKNSILHLNGGSSDAAVFIDYNNLYDVMQQQLRSEAECHRVLLEIIEDVCRNVAARKQANTTIFSAYGDFSAYPEYGLHVQRMLGSLGIEVRFTSDAVQPNAAELQLCIEATQALCSRPQGGALIVLSGDRPYAPLLNLAHRYSWRPRLATLYDVPRHEQIPLHQDDYESISGLLSPNKRNLLDAAEIGDEDWDQAGDGYEAGAQQKTPDYRPLTEPLCITALEIIDEYFGQYEEIYLTPLLRKLTETLGEDSYDPKIVISDLEEAGAVWLEKRRGFPHDYTVLLLDHGHPDIQRIVQPRDGTPSEEPYYNERPADGYA